MKSIHFAIAAITLAAACAASAQTTSYSTPAAFLPNVAAGSFTNPFTVATFSGQASASFTGGSFSYSIAAPNGLYGNNVFLGTNLPNEALTITFTGAPVTALGGNFYATNVSDAFQAAPITLTLSNGFTTTFTPSSVGNSYQGFTTAAAITSMTIGAPGASLYAGMDNFTVGSVVPEPGTWLMLGLGVSGLLLARRRQASV